MENIRHVALLVRAGEDLKEASRSALALAVENFYVHLFALELEAEMTDELRENLEWLADIEAEVFCPDPALAEKHSFCCLDMEEMGRKLREMDLIIPF